MPGSSESAPLTGDWNAAQFREAGLRAIDWVARYLEQVEHLPVVPRIDPGEVRLRIPSVPPPHPEPFDRLLADLDEIVTPGVTHWNHPGFFAYFGISGSAPGILGELVASAYNTNGMLWKSSPATTEVELAVLDWLKQMLDLPSSWFGLLVDTASVATLLGLAAAREAVPGLAVREQGLHTPGYPRLRVYASEQAHSSIEKAVITLGLGQVGLRKIGVDEQFRMLPEVLSEAIREDRTAGWQPCAVVATVGTTSTTSVDPVQAIAEVCAAEGVWLHVDAAYAGAAAILPEKRGYFAGCERADSYVMNPHKWLFTPIDASALFTSRPEVLRRAFQLVPDYLRTPDTPGATNLMDYGVQLGRRFRAIKLWWVIRSYGTEGIAHRIAEHCALALELAGWIDADPRFEVCAPVPFSTVCFRARWPALSATDADTANERLAQRVTEKGRGFLATTRLDGRTVIRWAIGNIRTEARHVRAVWEDVCALAADSAAYGGEA